MLTHSWTPRVGRLRLAALILAGLVVAPGCGGGGDSGPNDFVGEDEDHFPVFLGARVLPGSPRIVRSYPSGESSAVPVTASMAVQFSESVVAEQALESIRLFQAGSTSEVPGTVRLLQGQTVALFIPDNKLSIGQSYELSVGGVITDLENFALGSEARIPFMTVDDFDLDFEVAFESPVSNTIAVYRSTEAILLFSEPFTTLGPAGLPEDGNLIVSRNGRILARGQEYSLDLLPATQPTIAHITLHEMLGARDDLRIEVSRDVENIDGRKRLVGGRGHQIEVETQRFDVPIVLTHPGLDEGNGVPVLRAGALDAFPTEVRLLGDGTDPRTLYLVYVATGNRRGILLRRRNPRSMELVIADLNVSIGEGLDDGPILIGAFTADAQGRRSEITALSMVIKDTSPPSLADIGSPRLGGSLTLLTDVRDIALSGRMSESCAILEYVVGGASAPNRMGLPLSMTRVTTEDGFFVAFAHDGSELPPLWEPRAVNAVRIEDAVGNEATGDTDFEVQTIGVVGAGVADAQGAALLVAGYDVQDPEQARRVGSGAVIVEPFPPMADGSFQVVRSLVGGSARFDDADFAAIPTAQLTVTIVADGFDLWTVAGLDRPSAAAPRAVIPVLSAREGPSVADEVVDYVDQRNRIVVVTGAGQVDLDGGTVQLERARRVFDPEAGSEDQLFSLRRGQLQLFAATEEERIIGQRRFASSEPFRASLTSEADGVRRRVDWSGRESYSAAESPPYRATFLDSEVSGDGSGGVGPLGLVGDAATQLRSLRLIARLPGFASTVALDATSEFDGVGDNQSALLLLSSEFARNDSPMSTGVEDTPIELFLQPGLIDKDARVDSTAVLRGLRAELHVQDVETPDGAPASAFVRQRFVLTSLDLGLANFPLVPRITAPTAGSQVPHPPELTWIEDTSGESLHRVTLESLDGNRWTIYHPADGVATSQTFQVPLIPFGGAVPGNDFQGPGFLLARVESFDFDPFGRYAPGDSRVPFSFDYQRFYVTDLEREHLHAAGSDTEFFFETR